MNAPERAAPKPLVVIVEDEVELSALIARHLEDAGMLAQVYNSCAPALRFLQHNFANLLLLDVNLPDRSGFDLLEELRHNDIATPVIFVTGNSEEVSKVRGLEMGGDDYITKPFSFAEMVARVKAVLRRAEVAHDTNVTRNAKVTDEPFLFCGARIIPERLEIEFPDGAKAAIGRKPFGIMAYLYANQGVVVTRRELIHSVWGLHADVRSRSLDQYVVKIRDQFTEAGLDLGPFRTVHGVGYIYDPEGLRADA